MIVVDSSVWIDFLRGRRAAHVARLRSLLGSSEIIVGDLMLCEVLQGLENERAAREVESLLRGFEIVPISTKPKPSESRLSGATPSLSKPAARPIGLGKSKPNARTASRLSSGAQGGSQANCSAASVA